jgi:homoserine kinase
MLLAAGAYGCTISGAGPTAIAVVDDPNTGARVGQAMADAFLTAGLGVNTISVVRLDEEGARLL